MAVAKRTLSGGAGACSRSRIKGGGALKCDRVRRRVRLRVKEKKSRSNAHSRAARKKGFARTQNWRNRPFANARSFGFANESFRLEIPAPRSRVRRVSEAHRISRVRVFSHAKPRETVLKIGALTWTAFSSATRGGAPLRTRARTDTRAGEPRSSSARGEARLRPERETRRVSRTETRGGRRRRRERPGEAPRAPPTP